MIFTICKFFTRIIFHLLYRHKVYGVKKNLVKGAAIIAANHNSYLDPIALQLSVRGCLHHLARSTLFSNRFTGWLHRQWGSYPIKRNSGNSAAFKAALELFKQNKKLIIYPEGERSPTGELLPGKVGVGMIAIKSKVPVIPTYIGGTFEIYNRHRKFPKIWKTITCVFGTPLTFDDLINNETINHKEAYQLATDRIMSKIAELKDWYEKGCIGEVP